MKPKQNSQFNIFVYLGHGNGWTLTNSSPDNNGNTYT